MTAGNTCGTSAAQSLAVTVVATPATPGAITGTAAQCAAAAGQTYSITPVTYATTYTWTVPTGWTITAGAGTASITVTAGAAGQNGNITVTAGNTCGTSAAQTLAVTVIATPATPGAITGTAAQCAAAAGQTYSITPVTYATTYTWTVPTGWTITAGAGTASITVTAGAAGQNGNITVTAGNTCGTSAAQSLAVTVIPLPAQPGDFTTSTTLVCQGQNNVTYTVPDDPTVTYSWSYSGTGASITGTGNSVTVSYSTTATSGTLSVTATNSCGTSASRTLVITVNAVPTAPTVSVTQPTCTVATGTIAVTSTTTGLTFSLDGAPYVAYPAGGFTAVASGPHTLTAQNAGGCISSVTNTTVDAQPATPAAPTVSCYSADMCCGNRNYCCYIYHHRSDIQS